MSTGNNSLRRDSFASLTTWSLCALGAGLGLGLLGYLFDLAWVGGIAEATRPAGALWMSALQMTVIPLVITQMLAAIVGEEGRTSVGSLGVRAVVLFVGLLAIAGVFTLVLGPPLIGVYPVAPEIVEAISSQTIVPSAAREAAAAAPASFAEWIAGIIPTNVFATLVSGEILPILLFTVAFALAVTRLPERHRLPLAALFHSSAAAMMGLIRWILWATPLGVFALVLPLTLEMGATAVGLLGWFVLVVCLLMLLFTGVLYPMSAALGGTSVRRFARAVAPAQMVAVSTRSSLASLPALVEGGRDHLRLPESATGFVLPLCVSSFKVNRTISSTVKLLFLAHVYGVSVGPGALTTFVVTVIILSFSSVGVPGGGSAFKTLPAYLAAGIPIEGIVIMEAVDTIPDIFKTLVNVTGDMSVATILSRAHLIRVGETAGEAPVTPPEPLGVPGSATIAVDLPRIGGPDG